LFGRRTSLHLAAYGAIKPSSTFFRVRRWSCGCVSSIRFRGIIRLRSHHFPGPV